MTSPSAPIDADLSPFSNDVYYVLEESGVWKTTNLTAAGASTWEQVWSSGDFEGSEFGALLRIRCAYRENLVYVLGWGYDDASVSKAFVLKSQDAGGSWVQNWVAEIDDPADGSMELIGYKDSGMFFGDDLVASITKGKVSLMPTKSCIEADGDCGKYYGNQVAALIRINPPVPAGLSYPTVEWDVDWDVGTPSAGFPSQNYDDDGDAYPWCGCNNVGIAMQFGGASWSRVYGSPLTKHASNTLDARYNKDVIAIGWDWGHSGRWIEYACDEPPPQYPDCEGVLKKVGYVHNIVIDGVTYSDDTPSKALDCARSNPDWVYVGLLDKVMKSEDGGHTWEEWIDEHGAYDICVDPQAAGAIYYWDTEGELRLNSGGADQGSLLSDSAYNQHGRLARDINSGRLWAIDFSGNVRVRNLGSWTTQYEGSKPMGIKSYIDGNLIFLDSDSIQLSSDYGETWSDKTGDWTEYGSPKAANLMDDNL